MAPVQIKSEPWYMVFSFGIYMNNVDTYISNV